MNVITLSGYSATADVERLELGTFDSYGIEQLQVIKGDGWEDLNVIVTFNPPSKGKPISVILDGTDTEITFDVPPEATQKHYGKGKIVFVGKKDGVQRISCDLNYYVKMHSNCEGESPTTPTPDIVSQILAVAEKAEKTAGEAKEMAEQNKEAISDLKQDIIDAQRDANVLLGHAIGEQAVCNNALNQPLHGLIVYGKSTQDGTPSVTTPVAIVPVGSDGSVEVNFSDGSEQYKQIAFAVGGGLKGIPVASGGNVMYNGQMYKSDYLIADTGKLVRWIGTKSLSDELIDKMNGLTFRKTDGGYELGNDSNRFFNTDLGAMSSMFEVTDSHTVYSNSDGYKLSQQWISLPNGYATKTDYINFILDREITLDYVMDSPVESDLTQDETLAYREVLAKAPTTVVSASDSAMVEVTYPRDINSAFSSIITAILNMGGNLDGKDDNTWLLTN